jgi:uncharacterized membrane protein YciS (DUF1049 family)
MRRFLELLIMIAIGVAIVILTQLNLENMAQFTYWPGHTSPTLSVIVFVMLAFAAGVGVTMLAMGVEWVRKNVLVLQLRMKVKRLEEELEDLRNLPLREELRAAAEEAGGTPEEGAEER